MPSLNDTLTVGLVLILLFGAVSLYLYTRIQQCEQKLNLVESILLDIKMSAELRDYPDIPFKEPVAVAVSGPAPVQAHVQPTRTPPPTPPHEPRHTVVPFEDVHEAPLENLPSIDETREVMIPMQAVAAPAPAPVAASSRASIGANYESMTLTELKALAQQRNITGAKSMKRNQILEALRTSDRAAEASPVFQAAAEQPAAPASDIEGFTPLEGTTLTEINA
jgi:hypothetical protein